MRERREMAVQNIKIAEHLTLKWCFYMGMVTSKRAQRIDMLVGRFPIEASLSNAIKSLYEAHSMVLKGDEESRDVMVRICQGTRSMHMAEKGYVGLANAADLIAALGELMARPESSAADLRDLSCYSREEAATLRSLSYTLRTDGVSNPYRDYHIVTYGERLEESLGELRRRVGETKGLVRA